MPRYRSRWFACHYDRQHERCRSGDRLISSENLSPSAKYAHPLCIIDGTGARWARLPARRNSAISLPRFRKTEAVNGPKTQNFGTHAIFDLAFCRPSFTRKHLLSPPRGTKLAVGPGARQDAEAHGVRLPHRNL